MCLLFDVHVVCSNGTKNILNISPGLEIFDIEYRDAEFSDVALRVDIPLRVEGDDKCFTQYRQRMAQRLLQVELKPA